MHVSNIFVARLQCSLVIALVSTFSLTCRQRTFNNQTKSAAENAHCSAGIRLADYVQPSNQNCYVSGKVEWDTLKGFNSNIRLQPWIPCNKVELFSMAANRYEGRNGNRKHYYDFDKAVAYLTNRKFPLSKMIQEVFQNPRTKPLESQGHPVFEAPLHKALMQSLSQAKERVFLNSMLFGGAWGIEVIRQALLRVDEAKKQGRDFQIIILHDTLNNFNFRSESDEIWNFLVKNSMQGPYASNLVVLAADIAQRRTSAIPAGLDKITGTIEPVLKMNLSLTGTSDHSKLLIADAYTDNASMVVMSKNITDFNHTNYDEGVFIQGPAASLAMNSYKRDIELAVEKAKLMKTIDAGGIKQAQAWLSLDHQVMSPGSTVHVKGPGSIQVRITETNADDSVRNLEHNVMKLIAGAKKNIRIYNFLAYHPMVAKAVADASKRLGAKNVRMLLDTTIAYKLNAVFIYMYQKEMLFDPSNIKRNYPFEKISSVNFDESIRWRSVLPPKLQKDAGFIDIKQQQHVKSIIIDDEYLLAGSANFDFNTFKGSFREFSVVVKDASMGGAPSESASIFDKLWASETDAVKNAQMAPFQRQLGQEVPAEYLKEAVSDVIGTEHTRNEGMNPRNLDLQDSAGSWKQDCY